MSSAKDKRKHMNATWLKQAEIQNHEIGLYIGGL